MGDNSIISVFSNIWSFVCLKIPPQFQASWQHILFTLDMGSLKKITPFPFTFPKRCSLSFYILLLLITVLLLLYACAHEISLKYLFPEKNTLEICGKKYQECNTFCVTNFFPLNFKILSNKKYKICTLES